MDGWTDTPLRARRCVRACRTPCVRACLPVCLPGCDAGRGPWSQHLHAVSRGPDLVRRRWGVASLAQRFAIARRVAVSEGMLW